MGPPETGAWEAPIADEFETTMRKYHQESAEVVAAMCEVTTTGCGSAEEPDSAESSPGGETLQPLTLDKAPASEKVGQGDIPDLDLSEGLPDMSGDGGEVITGRTGARGVDRMLICGQPVLDPDTTPAGRLVGSSSGPEYHEYRQVTTYASATDAVSVMGRLRSLLAECPRQPADLGSGIETEAVWPSQDTDTGYDTVSLGLSFVQTGTDEPAPGWGETVQVTRIGRALFITGTSGEFAVDDLTEAVKDLTPVTRQFVEGLACFYTDQGC